MRRTAWVQIICVSAMLAASLRPAPTHAATYEEVDAAIKKAVAYLYSQQKDGNWEVVPARDPKSDHSNVKGWQWGGLSAAATCAILYAGESPQDSRIKQAIEFLLTADIHGTYALGFRCQVWGMLPPSPLIQQMAFRDAMTLIDANIKQGQARGYFPYYFYQGKPKPSDQDLDHSVSQYGVLGLWACSQQAVEIPTRAWQEIEAAWKTHQYESGGWPYRYKHENADWADATLSMTAAGVASLFITQETLHSLEGLDGSAYWPDENIDRGLKWISAHFKDYQKSRTYYTLYGIERIGVASGHKYFGGINWYDEGAAYLVKHQKSDGSFGDANDNDNARKVPDTAFALMFMARGQAPVLMNKLEYVTPQIGAKPKPPAWNQRPREVANISRWLGRQIEHDLNWQIVSLDAPVEDLLDAPLLWITGKEAFSFKPDEEAKLKRFVEKGGIILGNAELGSKAFSDSYRKLGQKLFPYEFRELPPGHTIYTSEQFPRTEWKRPPSLLGLSNNARELMLLIPQADPGKAWQLQSFVGGDREALAQLMADIFQYAVDKKNLHHKGQTFLVALDNKVQAKSTVKLARLQYAGNWDPEPEGWRRMANVMHNRSATDLAIETVRLGTGKLAGRYKVAHLTGTTPLALTAAEQDDLRKFIDGGGTLLVDAAGGSVEFAGIAEKELANLFKPDQMKLLPLDHPVYSTGQTIRELDFRQFVKKVPGKAAKLLLRGIERNGKVRVFFSPADLSAGLVGQPVDGIDGYDPKTASALIGNMILYAVK